MERVSDSRKETEEATKAPAFLYHMVPEDMRGDSLHPLNSLKDVHPDLYVAKSAKYEDRLHIMEQFLPTLEAAWNDVLHFTAIDPKELKAALVEAGMEPKEMRFYQVDPSLLDPKSTTVYLYQDKSSESKMSPESFREYDPEKLDEHAVLPVETKEYYKEMFAKGERPLMFVGVPHILHKGSIDVSNLPVITV
ncbi:hypothetical protein KJ819_01000 [Patescibacteria group bacterium]|nr:hypothetical protein [Patescibacteria group bacterium]MBU1500444.1 hypothetical protein [Patescibacteria group bacterium]MBU2080512.1 hypothetical protein [Patescibacteria group bacterium]MBU2123683.1 hypothetical protein [Patescibacteria group bacterium]MBU2194539.1 hypothetical protein [Patescibacteria group bacterium]